MAGSSLDFQELPVAKCSSLAWHSPMSYLIYRLMEGESCLCKDRYHNHYSTTRSQCLSLDVLLTCIVQNPCCEFSPIIISKACSGPFVPNYMHCLVMVSSVEASADKKPLNGHFLGISDFIDKFIDPLAMLDDESKQIVRIKSDYVLTLH